MNKAFKAAFVGAALALVGGGLALTAPVAHAATVLLTTTTTVSNNGAVSFRVTNFNAPTPSSPSKWAIDSFQRTTEVDYADAQACNNASRTFGTTWSSTDNCFAVTISDSGTFATVQGALQPNQGTGTGRTIVNKVPGTFTGSATYYFWTPNTVFPSASLIQNPLDNSNNPDAFTYNWPFQTISTANQASSGGSLQNNWSWTYSTSNSTCETWTDSFSDDYGQSINLADDGNITGNGSACPAPPTPTPTPPPVTITFGAYGNNVNPFGNGFDVYQQHARVNQPIAGWPATQHDPATHFLKEAEGSHFRFEYAPNGVGDGLCVSNPGDNALVLRACNPNVWQQFDYAGGHIISVVNGGIVNPNGTGAQLTVGSSPTPWGGSKYTWRDFSSLPA